MASRGSEGQGSTSTAEGPAIPRATSWRGPKTRAAWPTTLVVPHREAGGRIEWQTLLPSPTHARRSGCQVEPPLPQREEVGHRLTGVLEVGEPVDDRHRGMLGELLERSMGEDARRHHVHPARQVSRHVRHGLARAHPISLVAR